MLFYGSEVLLLRRVSLRVPTINKSWIRGSEGMRVSTGGWKLWQTWHPHPLPPPPPFPPSLSPPTAAGVFRGRVKGQTTQRSKRWTKEGRVEGRLVRGSSALTSLNSTSLIIFNLETLTSLYCWFTELQWNSLNISYFLICYSRDAPVYMTSQRAI